MTRNPTIVTCKITIYRLIQKYLGHKYDEIFHPILVTEPDTYENLAKFLWEFSEFPHYFSTLEYNERLHVLNLWLRISTLTSGGERFLVHRIATANLERLWLLVETSIKIYFEPGE